MNIFTMYLPQFHRIKENDEWWGEGFTEWTAVKGAEVYCEGQYQPRVPLNGNYYDLSDKQTFLGQADMMKRYGVDGQCFYHYWFENGRKILEKPAENLLRWKDVVMPFLFCWANVAWARTWSRLSNRNVWASAFERQRKTNDSGILLNQNYGDESQWKEHFEYLLPFFKDERYHKIENKPVFMIDRIDLVPCLDEMMDRWRQWAKEEGFDGIYLIGVNCHGHKTCIVDAELCHEPSHTIQSLKFKNPNEGQWQKLDYDEVWNTLLAYQSVGEKVIYGGFVDYDDTPRRGREGLFFENVTPEKFRGYLTELLAKNAAQENVMVFINAWNEWGEGMYLEPDEKNRYGFLEAIPYAKAHYRERIGKYRADRNQMDTSLEREVHMLSAKAAKYESYWRLMESWLCLKEENRCLGDFFLGRGIGSVAIYGIGILGQHLLKELDGGEIQVKYAIDRKSSINLPGIKVYSPEDDLPDVDKIVVTATYAYNDIAKCLRGRGYHNVMSLEEVMMEMTV